MKPTTLRSFPLDAETLRRSHAFRVIQPASPPHCGLPPMVRYLNGCATPDEAIVCKALGPNGTPEDWEMVSAGLKACDPSQCSIEEPADMHGITREPSAFDRPLPFSRCPFDKIDS